MSYLGFFSKVPFAFFKIKKSYVLYRDNLIWDKV